MESQHQWSFFTNHALVLFYLEANPKHTLRQTSLAVGLTERAVQRIVAELEEAGYLERRKVGRQNSYTISKDLPLRHPQEAHCTVRQLLETVSPQEDVLEEYKNLENWTVGERGSVV